MHSKRGFPGMLGSLDCMHWIWKNCPKAHKGQYQGKSGRSTVILEAIASAYLWIWHCFFGTPGSCNDINVLDRSPLLKTLIDSKLSTDYVINGRQRNNCYWLVDGIYPEWGVFVKTISDPQGEKNKYFAKLQEGARKDIERAFGVLQSRFHILANPSRYWYQKKMPNIIKACIIIHNMIIEEQQMYGLKMKLLHWLILAPKCQETINQEQLF
jgi:hypothetical protein